MWHSQKTTTTLFSRVFFSSRYLFFWGRKLRKVPEKESRILFTWAYADWGVIQIEVGSWLECVGCAVHPGVVWPISCATSGCDWPRARRVGRIGRGGHGCHGSRWGQVGEGVAAGGVGWRPIITVWKSGCKKKYFKNGLLWMQSSPKCLIFGHICGKRLILVYFGTLW